MTINNFEYVDYLTEAFGRVTEQFKDKPIFERYLRLLISEQTELLTEMQKLMQLRSIDTAYGVQLDIIGEIVGRPRGLLTADEYKFFGFIGDPLSGTLGSSYDASAGSPFYSLGQSTAGARVPSDEEYRLLIKAKIIKNTTKSTVEDTIRAFKFLFNTGTVTIDEYAPAKVRLGIGKILTPTEKGLLFEFTGTGGILPKTVGVNYEFIEFTSTRVFATLGFPSAYGAGDIGDPSVGGFLANLI